MSKRAAFHAKDGWYFQRTEEGGVRIKAPDSLGAGASQVIELDADSWVSAVAAVCWEGENANTFRQAGLLHNGHGPGAGLIGLAPGEKPANKLEDLAEPEKK